MPDADNADAWIISVTDNGTVYLGIDPITPAALANEMKGRLRDREQQLYIKADARTPYADVMRVLEAVRSAGVAGPTLLTAQQELPAPGSIVPPKGLEVNLDAPSSSGSIMVQVLSSGQQSPTLRINHQTVSSTHAGRREPKSFWQRHKCKLPSSPESDKENGPDNSGPFSSSLQLSLCNSPNMAGVLGHHRLSRLASPRFLELGHVLHHAVHAIFPRRVRIGEHGHTRHFRTPLLAPHAGES
jgi:hypothetical protein